MIVVDEDRDVRDWNDVLWRIVSSVTPEQHMFMGAEYPEQVPYPGTVEFIPPTHGMGFDATFGFKQYKHPLPPIAKPNMELMDKVASRWSELGLS